MNIKPVTLIILFAYLHSSCNDKKSIIGFSIQDVEVQRATDFSTEKLGHYILDSVKVIFRIPKNACSSCINREISILKENFKDNPMPLIVTSFDSKRDLLVFIKTFDLEISNICNRPSDFFESFKEISPYYLWVNKTMIVENIYIVP
jgi:hypothetical protein